MPAPAEPSTPADHDAPNIEMIGGFESTFLPAHDRDVIETTGHDRRWRSDLALLEAVGVTTLRYPVRWHRVEAQPGTYDWRETDRVLEYLHDHGLRVILDLVHHTSYPRWLDDGFADARFPAAYLDYAEATATRYPWITDYTLFNEPFATLFLSGHERIWPPYHGGVDGLVGLYRNVLPALFEASRRAREWWPGAQHVWVDSCEHHTGGRTSSWGRGYARLANDRRFVVLDLAVGRPVTEDRPFVRQVLEAGGEELLTLDPGHVDVVGLDYYAHSQWHFDDSGAHPGTPFPMPLSAQIEEYARRYERPVMLSETNIRGFASDRATWLKYTLEQCELAVARGVDLRGYCWFPFIDSADWCSLLARCEGAIDPVGVFWLDEDLERRTSTMARSYSLAAHGARAADLPAYRLQEPVRSQLAGYRPQLAHWDWVEPPPHELRFPNPDTVNEPEEQIA